MFYTFDRGLLSVENKEVPEVEIENASVILCRAALSDAGEFDRAGVRDNLLIVARDISDGLVKRLAEERQKGRNVHGVVAPGFNQDREIYLQDIALCVGCTVEDTVGKSVGSARRVFMTKVSTLIQSSRDVEARVEELKKQSHGITGYDKEKFLKRLHNFIL